MGLRDALVTSTQPTGRFQLWIMGDMPLFEFDDRPRGAKPRGFRASSNGSVIFRENSRAIFQ